MSRPVLVPTDGSAAANAVLPTARTLARLSGAEIALVRVLPARRGGGWSAISEQARDDLERTRTELTAPDLPVSCYIRYGDTAKQIVETARDLQSGLIAMTVIGLSGVDRVIAGSVSDEVLRTSNAPVLLSRWGTRAIRHLRRILVPTDGSPGAALALSAALPLARSSGATLTLLRVVEHVRDSTYHVAQSAEFGAEHSVGHDYEEANRVRAEDDLRHLASQLVDSGYAVTGIACVGKPPASIVERADELKSDLIVMSTHARTGAARGILGSVADAVVHQANCPVLLVHWRDWLGASEQRTVSAGQRAD
jgi:nucleotide-binding universal stress UspA family protein